MNIVKSSLENTPSPSISNLDTLINNRDKALSISYQVLDLISQLKLLTDDATTSSIIREALNYHDYQTRCRPNIRKKIDVHFWEKTLEESNYESLLTAVQFKEHKDQIKLDTPEYTREYVTSTFLGLFENRFDAMLSGITEVHSNLYQRYANNNEYKFQKKTIIENVFAGDFYSCFSNGKSKFNDFIKYLCLMDGIDITQLEADKQPTNILEEARKQGLSSYKFDQCEVRMFQKGSIHILLNERLDLLERLNDALHNYHQQAIPDAS